MAFDAAVRWSIPHERLLIASLSPIGVVAIAVFVCLGSPVFRSTRKPLPFRGRLFAVSLVCVAAEWSAELASRHMYGFWIPVFSTVISVLVLAGLLSAALACLPFRAWMEMIRGTGWLWLYSLLVGVAAWCLRLPLQAAWNFTLPAGGKILQLAAFHSTAALLGLILPSVVADPSTFALGTQRFSVIVEAPCSGLEGLGLMLLFAAAWLWFFRRENRFPQALILVPIALAAAWMLNIVRLVVLILIGNAGAPDVAMLGFHSQAGWIAFTAVAFLFAVAAGKWQWVRQYPSVPVGQLRWAGLPAAPAPGAWEDTGAESPATAAYLVPFLAILAASFISRAASANFEWLYPLRFVAAGWAIWHYRRAYQTIRWRLSWEVIVGGVAVFLVWIIPHFLGAHSAASALGTDLGTELSRLSPLARWSWIAVRIAAAVITVPFAEELAFRGFLARRLESRAFDALPYYRLTIFSMLISSLLFGLLHGRQWMIGVIAGLVFAALAHWRGRLGDAIAAHALSNLLLAAYVLISGDWALL